MPTYEYACDACEHEFEEFQSITAPPLKKCPKCGKPRLRRLIGTGAGVLFKGSGFYQTDYRSESYKKAAEAETKSCEAKTESKDSAKSSTETKSDAKPAAADSTARTDSAKATPSKSEKSASSSRKKKAG